MAAPRVGNLDDTSAGGRPRAGRERGASCPGPPPGAGATGEAASAPFGRRARSAAPEPELLHLTTTGRRTGRPRRIEIWFTRAGGRYYLVAETGERAQWVRNILADPCVRWRVGRERFCGRARVVDPAREADLAGAVRARSELKYGWGDGLIVELEPGGNGDGG